jgi:hypothetical protein
MILRFRFSSARNEITQAASFAQKPAADFGQRRTKLDLFNDLGFPLPHGIEIRVDLIAVTEIERDHGVYVGQTYRRDRRVILVDLFWSDALQKSLD